MCGIVGKALPSIATGVDKQVLKQMCAALQHRGPDSRGLFFDDQVGLGIQRLRVIDLVTGDQPILNENRDVVVVLNGEIYNFSEIRSRLAASGHRLGTAGDTEVIVHLYEEYGVGCVEHLHGMFAFALWDMRQRRLLLARDRLGKKPLFYATTPSQGLSFASELGALLQDADVPRRINQLAIDQFLTYGYIPAPSSIFCDVWKLPPAHTLVWDQSSISISPYWRPDFSQKLHVEDPRELHEPIRQAISKATRRRMIADVPVGAFLSGGIDSSAVVAAMAQTSGSPVKTFSVGFDSDAYNELPHARLVAERFRTQHEEFIVRPEAVSIVPKIVRHYGEPYADASAIPTFYLAEMTRRHVTVALNGDGGDETFGGYSRYVANSLAAQLDRLPLVLRRASAVLGERLGGGDITSVSNKAHRLLRSLPLEPADRYARYVSGFGNAERQRLYTDEFAAVVRERAGADPVRAAWRAATGDDLVDIMLEVDTATYLPGDLLTKVDIATMAHGLEARSPLLDHEFVEFAASIPAELKVRGREKKWLLREALRDWLPPEILDRPKQGFSVPVGEWFRRELKDLAHDVLLDRCSLARGYFRRDEVDALLGRHLAGTRDESQRLWSLFMLELWHREFVDQTAKPARLEAAA